ncbi:MAG: hypothetical protein A2W91_10835 [Bacteroidetes bacterium GWF2_38_335]|nr:MAG: hypothetical protein A2W91_10835 [Bacteroidetes bacterium GWF2_38_335]OFY81803.1 MAG: hypothetical protein A2281_06205 [Bacteroidetes bacterium RIFOXYA12_FULL_38_20]HBS87874.1 hypothetical protein [Bacteroidales bacterium]
MPVITLTSDWNINSFYTSAVRGHITCLCPDARIIDISHNIDAFNVPQAAFVLRNSFRHFPAGSIHIIAVNSEPDKEKHPVIVKYRDHYFISSDNGIYGLLMDSDPEMVIRIETNIESTFPEMDIFVPIACKIANGENIENLGIKTSDLYQHSNFLPTFSENLINGRVIFIDSYSNAISNITPDLFEKAGSNKPFDILFKSNANKINKINKKYVETSEGELLAIINSVGLLEIAMYKGRLAELTGLSIGDVIRIKFYDR